MPEIGGGFIRIRPDFTGFAEEVKGRTHEAVAAAAKDAAKLAIGAFAVGGIGEFIRETGKAAAQTQATLAQVQQTARNVAHASARDQADITHLVEQNAARTGFTVQQVGEAYGRLLVQTKNVHTATSDLSRAEDIARGRHIDLAQAATVLARAEGGNFNSLTRLGITIPKVTTAQAALAAQIARLRKEQQDAAAASSLQSAAGEKLTHTQRVQRDEQAQTIASEIRALEARKAQAKEIDTLASKTNVLAQVQQRFAGQAARYAQTAAGGQDRFKVATEELQATIGQHYLPALAGVENHLTSYLLELQHSQSFQHAVQTGVNDLAGGFHALGGALEIVGPPLLQIAGYAARFVGAVGPGPILAYVAGLKAARFVLGQFAAGEVEAVTAEERATLAANAQTAAVERLTAALEAQAVAGRSAAASSALSGAGAVVGAEAGAGAAVAERGLLARLGGGAAGLVGLGGLSATAAAATGGVALLAGGLYYLSTIESQAHRTSRELTDTLGTLGATAREQQSAIANLRGATAAIGQGRLDTAGARLAIEQAKQQLALDQAQHAPRLQLAADAQAVKAAEQQWRTANHELVASLQEQRAATEDVHTAERRHEQALNDVTHRLDASLQAGRQVTDTRQLYGRTTQQAASSEDALKHAADRTIATLEAQRRAYADSQPVIARNIGYVESLVRATKQTPPRVVTNFLLEHGSADASFRDLFAKLKAYAASNPRTVASLDTSQAFAALEALAQEADSVKQRLDAALGAAHDTPPGLGSLAPGGPSAASAASAAGVVQGAAQAAQAAVSGIGASVASSTRSVAEAAAAAADAAANAKQQAADQRRQAAQAAADAAQQRQQQAEQYREAQAEYRAAQAAAKLSAIHPTPKEIAQQVAQAVAQAKANLQSLGSSLASTVSTIIDAMTAKATKAIQRQIDTEQQAAQSLALQRSLTDAQTSAARAQADAPLEQQVLQEQLVQAQEALAALQKQGTPAQGQSANDYALQVSQAQLAVVQAQRALADFPQSITDAQQKVADAQRAIQDNTLSQQAAALQKQADAEKQGAERRVTALTDELARGQINVRTFNQRLRDELERDGATYTSAGAASGKAFADGFKAQLATLAAQAQALIGFYGIGGGGQTGSITSPGITRAAGEAQRRAGILAAEQRLGQAQRALAQLRQQNTENSNAAGGLVANTRTGHSPSTFVDATAPGILGLERTLRSAGYAPTSGRDGKHVADSYHYRGEALDFGTSQNDLRRLWSVLFPRRKEFVELLGPDWLPSGGLYHNGVKFTNAKLQAEHQDHIHVALTGANPLTMGAPLGTGSYTSAGLASYRAAQGYGPGGPGGTPGSAAADIVSVGARMGLSRAELETLVAEGIQESGLAYHPTPGDNGTSFGPFQFHIGGALGSHSRTWAESIAEVQAQAARSHGVVGGAAAARLQGPADKTAYAESINAIIASGRADAIINQYLGGGGGAASMSANLAGGIPERSTAVQVTSTGSRDMAASIGAAVRRAIGDGAALRIDHLEINAPNASAEQVATMVIDKLQPRLRALIAAELKKR